MTKPSNDIIAPFYDLEKALRHAELTWAQDPFGNTDLFQKPVFDIDFSKNPAELRKKKHITTVTLPEKGELPAFNPTEQITVFHASVADKQKMYRHTNTPLVIKLVEEDDKFDSGNAFADHVKFSIEDLTWTLALVRRKIGSVEYKPRQPRQARF